MALDPKIASIKAAGTYRFEFDKSQVVSIPANQTRLIVGFSKTGPFNTPVFVPDTAFFKQVYGELAYVALSMKDYENLAINIAEMRRYLNQQKEIIVYYEKAANPKQEKK